ncbi:hypothetical protein KKC63_00015 [Patescibacteria group bacterium]|nr:hypothetical protein [Patescibacteria group bacterium]MBU4022839.1 hypothetical protein [Patescibacteria group bacterium]MBU4078331.1 hypothetical protein [Patescibacteria group bacterium]
MSKKIIGLISLVAVMGLVLVPAFALATVRPTVGLTPVATEPPLLEVGQIMTNIIRYMYGFIIVLVVLMAMVSAYMFVTAGGNPEQVTKARNWLMYALIGLAVAVLARGIVTLVLTMIYGT